MAGSTMDQLVSAQPETVETPSGKGAGDENFPVASLLVARRLRPHVARFYAFARAADDIADNPGLPPEDKLRRLDLLEAGLDGRPGVAVAFALRESLAETGVPDRHARDLLAAFRQDATKLRYRDWDDLLGYCELSANPVGRYLMDLHGEARALWPAADALCTALQILNHLQDCQADYRRLDRVYLPVDWLAGQGIEVEVLDLPAAPPGLRRVLDLCLDGCEALIATARTRPVRPRSRRLHAEMALITRLAARLAARLRRQDPLAGRVGLSRADFARAGLSGLAALAMPRRG
jgi:hydroxysqualene synthase